MVPPKFFLKYKRKMPDSRVKLCGIHKKNICGSFNLHKLLRKTPETTGNQILHAVERNVFGKYSLMPAFTEVT